MSDGAIFLLVVAATLGLLYLWLRGRRFAGVLVALASAAIGFQFIHWLALPAGAAFGLAPWFVRWSLTPAGHRFWADYAANPRSRPSGGSSPRLIAFNGAKRRDAVALARAYHSRGWTFLRGTGAPDVEAEMSRLGLFGAPIDVDASCTQEMMDAFPGSGVPMPMMPSRVKPRPPESMWHQGNPILMKLATDPD